MRNITGVLKQSLPGFHSLHDLNSNVMKEKVNIEQLAYAIKISK